MKPAQFETQEPVAWLHWLHGPVRVLINKDEAMMELDRLNREYPVDKNARQMKPLYTTPPQRTEPVIDKSAAIRIATLLGWGPKRTWVELTDEEISASSKGHMVRSTYARAIEAKLKHKNGYTEERNQ